MMMLFTTISLMLTAEGGASGQSIGPIGCLSPFIFKCHGRRRAGVQAIQYLDSSSGSASASASSAGGQSFIAAATGVPYSVVRDLADKRICKAVHDHFSASSMWNKLGDKKSNQEKMVEMGKNIVKWCSDRYGESHVPAGSTWATEMVEMWNSTKSFNMVDEQKIPSMLWVQCVGYATAATILVGENNQALATAGFMLSNAGTAAEQYAGCGNIVHAVSKAVTAQPGSPNYVEGLNKRSSEKYLVDAKDVSVVTVSPSLAEKYGLVSAAGLLAVAVAGTEYFLLSLCDGFKNVGAF